MRRSFFILHKYAGLTLGLLLSLIGLTGSLLVFDHALDEKLAPETVTFAPSNNPASYSEVLAAAQAAVPGNPQPVRLMTPRQPGSPHVIRFPSPEGAPGPIEVSVSPTDAEVLAVRGWGKYTMSWIYRLHYTLLAGSTGKTIVGLMGLLLLVFCVTGVVLWWPRKGRWRRALVIRRDRNRFRLFFDLHKVLGIYFLPLLLLIAFSGVTMVFPKEADAVVGSLLPMEARPTLPRSRTDQGTPLDPETIVALGHEAFPGGELKRIYLPRDAGDTYGLSFRAAGEPWQNYGASFVRLDQYSGEILLKQDVTSIPLGNQVVRWQFPLHNGDALGLFGRWLILLTGLVPSLLFGTGIYLWWKKHKLKRARHQAAPAPHKVQIAEV
ncbi:PepSY-associated TM helix [Microbulbifer aggregans]|uniref:PepSY-associated TM helix n=1 Tax=Microbulbifer aggregans TaxID=1769779 RepID=A0A1C9W7F8_9GAMM|nr:PepSY-associated TM helix domain-containing protein [Microbulbifer aggregans]AOS97081.1 PepSY-associated TM helix [Microbulbifer aggregans]